MKPIIRVRGLVLCGLFLLAANAVLACTTFVLEGDGRIYLGRNLDWYWEDGWVVVNPRNISKTAVVAPGSDPAKWTAKYGSVTFNQFGREMPFGGMNEAGLVVEDMWLGQTEYPPADARPAINLLQWIQYQLDTCATVGEVVASDRQLRVQPLEIDTKVPARVHYIVSDASGDCATIEFLKGKMVVHRGSNLPERALANEPYAESLASVRVPTRTKATESPVDKQYLNRFSRAAERAAAFQPGTAAADLDYAFDTLQQVCQGQFTVWRMVYDIPGRTIHYRTRSNPRERTLVLTGMDFDCARPARFADIQANPTAGGALEFQDLTEARLRAYFERFCGSESVRHELGDLQPITGSILKTLESYRCAGK